MVVSRVPLFGNNGDKSRLFHLPADRDEADYRRTLAENFKRSLPTRKMVKDLSLYFMNEETYYREQAQFAKKTFEEFARLESINVIWQKAIV